MGEADEAATLKMELDARLKDFLNSVLKTERSFRCQVANTTAPHNHGSSGTHDRNRSTRMPSFLRVRRVVLAWEARACRLRR